jgi:hypothetical protein
VSEYALGIPSREISHELPEVKQPTTWEYVVHDHHAERRGRHFDIRLADPKTGFAHSWAMPAKWPEPGQKTWAIQQPTHTMKYMDFEGVLPEGYGKGAVLKHDRERVEVVTAKPGHINFNIYRGTGPEEYTLHRISDRKWQLHNRTIHRQKTSLPDTKPPYRETKIDQVEKHLEDPNYVASAKIDDAHNLFVLPQSGEQIRVVSYRPSKRSPTGIIEHTHKVPALFGVKTPPGLGGTILRGGLFAMDPKTGKATDAKDLAGMLNSNVWNSREKQKVHGELIPILYDVVMHRGRNMETASYGEKLKVLREVADALPFELPRMAFTEKDKKELLSDIRKGHLPETKEGVVFWHLREGSQPPIKTKFVKDHDVYIRDFFPGEGKYHNNAVGGFLYSHDPDGPIVGRVGTGLSDELRHDMHEHPNRYKGLVARVKAQDKYPSGALRAPAFADWHLDKNDPQALSQVKLASLEKELVFMWGDALS